MYIQKQYIYIYVCTCIYIESSDGDRRESNGK